MNREKRHQIEALGQLGWSLRRIEEHLGVRRETVGRYLRKAGIEVRAPRHRRLRGDPKAASEATTDLTSKPASDPTTDLPRVRSACEPHRLLIEEALGAGRNMKSIWQELVDERGFTHSYESVKRFVRKLKPKEPRRHHPRIETAPGQEAQVDYGLGAPTLDPRTGKYKRPRLFQLTLGYSRKTVRLVRFESSTEAWCELHQEAFRRLGGVPKVIILDNLKEGVKHADRYDPRLNPVYRDMLAHYGVTGIPARVRHPDRKGKVEREIGYTQDTALKGRRFESLESQQEHLDHWSKRWADTRIHGTTKRQVAQLFEEEREHLAPLPVEPFRCYSRGVRSVHFDGCIEVEASYYSVPPQWIGRRVEVQWNGTWVRALDPTTGELLRESRRIPRGGHRMHPADKPANMPSGTKHLLERASRLGTSVRRLADAIYQRREEAGVRSILGLVSLAKKHGKEALNHACQESLDIGAPTYRFVRRWLEKHPPTPITVRQVDPLIRQLTEYRDLINHRTQDLSS